MEDRELGRVYRVGMKKYSSTSLAVYNRHVASTCYIKCQSPGPWTRIESIFSHSTSIIPVVHDANL